MHQTRLMLRCVKGIFTRMKKKLVSFIHEGIAKMLIGVSEQYG